MDYRSGEWRGLIRTSNRVCISCCFCSWYSLLIAGASKVAPAAYISDGCLQPFSSPSRKRSKTPPWRKKRSLLGARKISGRRAANTAPAHTRAVATTECRAPLWQTRTLPPARATGPCPSRPSPPGSAARVPPPPCLSCPAVRHLVGPAATSMTATGSSGTTLSRRR